MQEDRYVLLDIHGDFARVRMYVGTLMVDEDFGLPDLLAGIAPTLELYEQLIQDSINRRMKEISNGVTSAEQSKVVDSQVEQIIQEVDNV